MADERREGAGRTRTKVLVTVVALALATLATVRFVTRPSDPYARERMSEMIELRCAETGRTWTMTRGLMEAQLRIRAGKLDADEGLESQFAEGRRTAFPTKAGVWEETILRINTEKSLLTGPEGP